MKFKVRSPRTFHNTWWSSSKITPEIQHQKVPHVVKYDYKNICVMANFKFDITYSEKHNSVTVYHSQKYQPGSQEKRQNDRT